MSCLAIIAALPREVAGLTRGFPADGSLRDRGIHLHRLPGVVVVAAGMGSERVTAAVAAALAEEQIGMLVSAGLAGACLPPLRPGQVLEASVVIDVRTGERFGTDAPVPEEHPEEDREEHQVVLASTPAIASVREKARLAQSYGAAMVDMEAATVGRLARAHDLRFRAIKGLSDAHDFELASLSRFEGQHGSFRTGHFALHTALRPHHWRSAARLGRNSNRALDALQTRLRQFTDDLA